MFQRQLLSPALGVVGLTLLSCALGCGTKVSVSGGGTKFVVNGQTVDLKETATEVVRQTFQTVATPRVIVDVFSGKITVDAGPDGDVEAQVTKTCIGETKEEAKAHLALIDVQMKQEGDTLRITARRSDATKPVALIGQNIEDLKKQYAVRSADAALRVPAAASLELKTAYGDVKVNSIAGQVEAETTSGAVIVTGGKGELKLRSNYGNLTIDGRNTAVTAETQSGQVSVKGAKGPLDISSGYGAVTIDGGAERVTAHSSSGNIAVKEAKGPVKLTSGYGIVTVDGAAAVEAETESGDIFVRGATGSVQAQSGYGKVVVEQAPAGATLQTSSGDIRLRAGQGTVKLTSGYGHIDAEVSGAVVTATTNSGNVQVRGRLTDGEHTLRSGYGNVTLTLPAASQFRLDARTNYGRVTTAFGLPASGKSNDKHLEGTVGEAPKMLLKLTTNSGNIDLRKN